MNRAFTATLPWPPSINKYYGRARNHVYIKAEGRAFREEVVLDLQDAFPEMRETEPGVRKTMFLPDQELSVTLDMYPPDRKDRDLDNVEKAILDALQHAGVYANDCMIKRKVCHMHPKPLPKKKGLGKVVVTITHLTLEVM